MQHDEVIWQVINPGFCSFKVKTKEKIQNFCKNPNNLTGLCNRSSCPLANSRYATIHEDKGVCYLWMKTIERAHSPLNMWEKIKLPRNYTAALAIIDQQLQYWPKFIIHKAKQRLTRIHQYLIRMRRLKLKVMPKIVGITKKTERREATREAKALKAARLSDAITQELVQRLQEGTYEGFISFPQKEYEKALNVVGESQEEEELEEGDEQDEVEGEMEHELDLEGLMEGADGEKLDLNDADEFVEAFGDDEDLEDFPGGEGGEDDGEDAGEESKDSKEEAKPKRPKRAHTPSSTASAPTSKRRPAGGSAPGGRRARLEVEYEVEQEKDQATAQE